MTETSIADILSGRVAIGERVTVKGWVRTRREARGDLSFIHLYDGTTLAPLQIVADSTLDNYAEEIAHLTSGCAIIARGALTESRGKGQTVEVQAEAVEVVGWVEDPEHYPIQPKAHSFEYLREIAHLR